MKGKSTSAGLKLVAGFFIMFLLTGAFILFSYQSFGRLSESTEKMIQADRLYADLAGKDTELFTWTDTVDNLLTDSTNKGGAIETDDHKCAFGSWLYGNGRREASALIPSLEPLFRNIEKSHAQMHAAAIDIINSRDQDERKLDNILQDAKTEQQGWLNTIKDALLDEQNTLTGLQVDPTRCILGRWLYSDESRTLYLSDPEFAQLLTALDPLHKRLHGSIADIRKFLISGDRAGAVLYFKRAAEPVFRKTAAMIDQIMHRQNIDMGNFRPAGDIYVHDLLPALGDVRSLLDSVKNEVLKYTPSHKAFVTDAGRTKEYLGIAGFAVILFGLLIGYILFRIISSPGNRAYGSAPSPPDKGLSHEPAVQNMYQRTAREVNDLAGRAGKASGELVSVLEKMDHSVAGWLEKNNDSIKRLGRLQAPGAVVSDTHPLQVEIMSQIRESAGNIATVIAALSEAAEQSMNLESTGEINAGQEGSSVVAEKLSMLVESVKEISEQANLLSLNASIEAARSGSQGKGFAILADEMGKLAENSVATARDISHFIKHLSWAPGTGNESGFVMRMNLTASGESLPTMRGDVDGAVCSPATLAALGREIEELTERLEVITTNSTGLIAELTTGLGAIEKDLASSARESTAAVESVMQAKENARLLNNSLKEIKAKTTGMKDMAPKSIGESEKAPVNMADELKATETAAEENTGKLNEEKIFPQGKEHIQEEETIMQPPLDREAEDISGTDGKEEMDPALAATWYHKPPGTLQESGTAPAKETETTAPRSNKPLQGSGADAQLKGKLKKAMAKYGRKH